MVLSHQTGVRIPVALPSGIIEISGVYAFLVFSHHSILSVSRCALTIFAQAEQQKAQLLLDVEYVVKPSMVSELESEFGQLMIFLKLQFMNFSSSRETVLLASLRLRMPGKGWRG